MSNQYFYYVNTFKLNLVKINDDNIKNIIKSTVNLAVGMSGIIIS